MTNKQWLVWRLVDMPDEEIVKEFPGLMCDICAAHIVPTNKPCPPDCDSKLLAWLQQGSEDVKDDGRARLIRTAKEIKKLCQETRCEDCPFCYGYEGFTYKCLLDSEENDGSMPKDWVV